VLVLIVLPMRPDGRWLRGCHTAACKILVITHFFRTCSLTGVSSTLNGRMSSRSRALANTRGLILLRTFSWSISTYQHPCAKKSQVTRILQAAVVSSTKFVRSRIDHSSTCSLLIVLFTCEAGTRVRSGCFHRLLSAEAGSRRAEGQRCIKPLALCRAKAFVILRALLVSHEGTAKR
jgi:hypothetical protein